MGPLNVVWMADHIRTQITDDDEEEATNSDNEFQDYINHSIRKDKTYKQDLNIDDDNNDKEKIAIPIQKETKDYDAMIIDKESKKEAINFERSHINDELRNSPNDVDMAKKQNVEKKNEFTNDNDYTMKSSSPNRKGVNTEFQTLNERSLNDSFLLSDSNGSIFKNHDKETVAEFDKWNFCEEADTEGMKFFGKEDSIETEDRKESIEHKQSNITETTKEPNGLVNVLRAFLADEENDIEQNKEPLLKDGKQVYIDSNEEKDDQMNESDESKSDDEVNYGSEIESTDSTLDSDLESEDEEYEKNTEE